MSEEKQKNEKRYETEWSFSFEEIGNSINKALGTLGEEAKEETFTAAKEGAQSARIIIGGSVGRNTIIALERGSDNLFEADVRHLGEMRFEVSGDSEKVITLRPHFQQDFATPLRRAIGQIGKKQDLYLRVRISPDIPVHLELHGGVGPTDFDLSALDLIGLKTDGGVGPTTLSLPTTDHPYNVNLDGGVGGITINAPATTHVRMDLDGGVGPAVLNIPADASLDIKMKGGVGGTSLNVAPGVALHVEADGGLGGVNVPASLKRIKSNDDFISKGGVWESAGFALASKRVNVDYDGGVGGFRIKQQDVEIV
ncbi:MAG TPA: hypothetical protein VHL11_23425 [Phototrophicaceae bacterium]|nr:hypothetical protein [Phototrophicaceae bacterium]